MKRAREIAIDKKNMTTLVDITSAFEGLASMRISQIKNKVKESQAFFAELWSIYTQLRVDDSFHYNHHVKGQASVDKELFIIITAEGGFSGDIDQKLISMMLKDYKKGLQDIVVIGHHGAIQLVQNNIPILKYFKLPEHDANINTAPIILEVLKHKSTTVYYQTYLSLMVQDVKKIALSKAVAERGQNVKLDTEEISEKTYIFEPSTFAVVDHLEKSMLQIAINEAILESKLAQFASRFRAMSQAHERSDDLLSDLTLALNRSMRSARDERMKEIMNGLRAAGASNV